MNNLRKIRLYGAKPDHRKTQQEIADYCNKSKSYISQLEANKIKDPSYYTCIDIANFLGVDVQTIFPRVRKDDDLCK